MMKKCSVIKIPRPLKAFQSPSLLLNAAEQKFFIAFRAAARDKAGK
jgi:hypothetical protein